MSFADTYSHEVLETRRIRSQRARFWAKIVSLVLMFTMGAVFYTEPQLRQSLLAAGTQAVMNATGRGATPAQTPAIPGSANIADWQKLLQQAQGAQNAPAEATETGVKVNRYGPATSARPQFQRVRGNDTNAGQAQPAPQDSTAMADQLGKLLEKLKVGQ